MFLGGKKTISFFVMFSLCICDVRYSKSVYFPTSSNQLTNILFKEDFSTAFLSHQTVTMKPCVNLHMQMYAEWYFSKCSSEGAVHCKNRSREKNSSTRLTYHTANHHLHTQQSRFLSPLEVIESTMHQQENGGY